MKSALSDNDGIQAIKKGKGCSLLDNTTSGHAPSMRPICRLAEIDINVLENPADWASI